VTYCYPGIDGKPIIIVGVQCLLSHRGFFTSMLIDTGADETCFPASFAELFGHKNDHPHVEVIPASVQGIGGFSDSYLHSVQVSLLDPVKSTTRKPVIAWSSKIKKSPFVDKLECPHGLLGMDIMKEWREICFQPHKKGLWIKIVI
jgi:hypothetical protein